MRLCSLIEAISKKESIDELKRRTLSKLKDDRITVEKLGAGKLVVSSIFKSQSGKAEE